jgi:hypothetical protein
MISQGAIVINLRILTDTDSLRLLWYWSYRRKNEIADPAAFLTLKQVLEFEEY